METRTDFFFPALSLFVGGSDAGNDKSLVNINATKITVYGDHYTVEFKAGFKFDIER